MCSRKVFFCIAMCLLIFPAVAYSQSLVFDYGPLSGTNGGCWSNSQAGQNFAEQFSFTEDTTVNRIDIFTCSNLPGSSVHIKILSDAGGDPGAILYQEDQIPASWTSESSGGYRVTCNLTTPFVAQANTTYWIGVAGNDSSINQYSVLTPGDGHMAQFSGTSFSFHTSVGDMMFQLYSNASPISHTVPTMTEWGMIVFIALAGLGSVYYLRRSRRA